LAAARRATARSAARIGKDLAFERLQPAVGGIEAESAALLHDDAGGEILRFDDECPVLRHRRASGSGNEKRTGPAHRLGRVGRRRAAGPVLRAPVRVGPVQVGRRSKGGELASGEDSRRQGRRRNSEWRGQARCRVHRSLLAALRCPEEGSAAADAGRPGVALAAFVKRPQADAQIGAGSGYRVAVAAPTSEKFLPTGQAKLMHGRCRGSLGRRQDARRTGRSTGAAARPVSA
jgi:hypothetical protein